jgi:hypothetical protein
MQELAAGRLSTLEARSFVEPRNLENPRRTTHQSARRPFVCLETQEVEHEHFNHTKMGVSTMWSIVLSSCGTVATTLVGLRVRRLLTSKAGLSGAESLRIRRSLIIAFGQMITITVFSPVKHLFLVVNPTRTAEADEIEDGLLKGIGLGREQRPEEHKEITDG